MELVTGNPKGRAISIAFGDTAIGLSAHRVPPVRNGETAGSETRRLRFSGRPSAM
jgi:hypothetical protein